MSAAPRSLIVLGIALALTIAATGCSRAAAPSEPSAMPSPSAQSAAASPTTPSQTPDLRPVPMPLAGAIGGEVVDPALATLPLAEALRIGRSVPPLGEANWIGTNPVARLMRISNTNADNAYGPVLAWVIVTDDAPPFGGKGLPTTSSPPPYHGCLSWTIIAMDGTVLDHLQSRYLDPNYPPALPR